MNNNHLFWIIGLLTVTAIMYIISNYENKTQLINNESSTTPKTVGYKKINIPKSSIKKYNKSKKVVEQPKIQKPIHIFMDIAKQDFLKDPHIGRVIFEVYPQYAPKTVKNFITLCNQKKYINTPFHRIIQGFMIQGGDIVNQDGTGSYSIYGGEGSTFDDEEFILKHDGPGYLSMANSGKNTNGSQFFITTQSTPHLDGKHVIFGKVIKGIEYIHELEKEITDSSDRPIRKCYISNCGIWQNDIKPEYKKNGLLTISNSLQTEFDNQVPSPFQL